MALSPQDASNWTNFWHNALEKGAQRQYLPDIAQSQRDIAVGNAGITGARAENAPQLYGSQAQDAENRAGLSGVDLQFAPQMNEQKLQSGGLTNMINQMKLQQAQAQMNAPPQFSGSSPFGKMQQDRMRMAKMYREDSPQVMQMDEYLKNQLQGQEGGMDLQSPFGKMQADRAKIAQQFGEDSPQVQQFDKFIETQMQGKQGITVFDPKTGDPMINIGGSRGAGSLRSGGTFMNPITGEVFAKAPNAARTRDARTIAGAENVRDYVEDLISNYPEFLTMAQKGMANTKGLSNYIFGTQFEEPSKLAEADAAALTMAEGFINTFGLNATNENVRKAEEIFKPKLGEAKGPYINRVSKQMLELSRVEKRAKGRLGQGISLGTMEGQGPTDSAKEKRRRYNPETGRLE
jgi:hypothetical protein